MKTDQYKRFDLKLHLLCAVVVLPLLIPLTALAHTGPPFPIIVDQNVGSCVISVWADPNVGVGTFFVMVDPLPGGQIPSDLKVRIGVQPVSNRLAEATYPADRDNLQGQVQFKSVIPFDAQEFWRIRVQVEGGQKTGEAMTTVEVTPPGYGRWDLIVYLVPFAIVGLVWLVAIVRKRSRKALAPIVPPVPD